jgi:hypothetical protein
MDKRELEQSLAEAERAARELGKELKRAKALVEDTRQKLRKVVGSEQPEAEGPRT